MTQLAIYDMDRTITRTGTYTPFLLHAARRLAPWRLALTPLVLLAMLAYALRIIGRRRLKEWSQTLLIGRSIARGRLAPIAESFADQVMRANILPGALARIAGDRAGGRRLVLATASYRLYVEAIASRLGFDAVIATNSIAGLNDRVVARIDGVNCYGPDKLRMIEAWLRSQGIERADADIRFYSDHVSDLPVMLWADAAFAANPSRRMRRAAGRMGWPILDWRDPPHG